MPALDELYVPTADAVTASATDPNVITPDNVPAVILAVNVLSYSLFFVIVGSEIVNCFALITPSVYTLSTGLI